MVGKSNNDLGESLGVRGNHLNDILWRTFRPVPKDNLKKSLACQCYRGALPL